MKMIQYKPAIDELIPDGAVLLNYPVNGAVVSAMVEDYFATAGTVLYDSNLAINDLGEPLIQWFEGYAPEGLE